MSKIYTGEERERGEEREEKEGGRRREEEREGEEGGRKKGEGREGGRGGGRGEGGGARCAVLLSPYF